MFQCDTLRENVEKGLLFIGLCGAVMFFFDFLRKKRALFARVFWKILKDQGSTYAWRGMFI